MARPPVWLNQQSRSPRRPRAPLSEGALFNRYSHLFVAFHAPPHAPPPPACAAAALSSLCMPTSARTLLGRRRTVAVQTAGFAFPVVVCCLRCYTRFCF